MMQIQPGEPHQTAGESTSRTNFPAGFRRLPSLFTPMF
jgi:hypothetical protein